jgi:hypothetical protein
MAFSQVAGKIFKHAKKKIPLGDILDELEKLANGPIGDTIRGWLRERMTAKPQGMTVAELDQRINQLDERILDLARLVPELENRHKAMAEVIQTLSARIIILAIVTGISTVLSLTALILVLLK